MSAVYLRVYRLCQALKATLLIYLLALVVFTSPLTAVADCPDQCQSPADASCTLLKAPIYHAQELASSAYYFSRLLRLALELTRDDFGAYCLQQPDNYFTDDRLKASLQKGLVDVIWYTTSQKEERQLRAIHIPLLGELNHYRMLLIRRGDEAKFAQVNTLQELQAVTGDMHSQWADAQVMSHNQLPYVAVTGYSQLFRMLAAGRFDYFSRGIHQIVPELQAYPELDLMIEPHILLKYPNSTYFFVRHSDKRLAERIALGLKRAQHNGQFATLFQSIDRFRWAQQQLRAGNRKVISLDRPWRVPHQLTQ